MFKAHGLKDPGSLTGICKLNTNINQIHVCLWSIKNLNVTENILKPAEITTQILFYHLSERGDAGQADPLRGRGAVQGKGADQSGLGARSRHGVFDGEEDGAAQEDGGFPDALRNGRTERALERSSPDPPLSSGGPRFRPRPHLGRVDGVGVVGVGQQVHVEAQRHVAHGGDLILGRPPGVEEAGGGELELLQGVEAQTLHEGAFDLTDRHMDEPDRSLLIHFLSGGQTCPMSKDGFTLLPTSITMSVLNV